MAADYQPETRNWCQRCGVHVSASYSETLRLCPPCLDRRIYAKVKMAGTCRG